MYTVRENFRGELTSPLAPLELGAGHIERGENGAGIRLVVEGATPTRYGDAQIYDYAGRSGAICPATRRCG
jgi:hypothetical protein